MYIYIPMLRTLLLEISSYKRNIRMLPETISDMNIRINKYGIHILKLIRKETQQG